MVSYLNVLTDALKKKKRLKTVPQVYSGVGFVSDSTVFLVVLNVRASL